MKKIKTLSSLFLLVFIIISGFTSFSTQEVTANPENPDEDWKCWMSPIDDDCHYGPRYSCICIDVP